MQLRSIDLSHTKVSDKGLVFVALLRNLECLNLSCSSVTDEGLKIFKSGCTTLQKLDVSCLSVSSFGIAALTEKSVQLQHLNLSYCKLTGFSSLQNLKMLQVIKLGGCSLDEANLNMVGRECRGLKELSLIKCVDMTDVGVVSAVTALTGLQKLDLTYCFDITDVALKAVTTNCRGLLSLNMEGCLSVTAKGLVLIGKFCLSFEDLDLSTCKLNDDVLKSIARCTELRFLKIGSCMDITNAGLVHIGATCKNLLEFNCSRSRRVDDEGIAAMASGCRRLKKVVMSECQFVTDASLQSLASFKRSRGTSGAILSGDIDRSLPRCWIVQTLARVGCLWLQLSWRPWHISYLSRMSKPTEDLACTHHSDKGGDDGSSKHAVFAKYGSGSYAVFARYGSSSFKV